MLAAAEAVAALWQGEFGFEPPALAASRGVSGEADLDRAMHRAEVPVLDVDPERTWLWSDLHLGDRAVLSAWNRPFRDVDDMASRRSVPSGWARSPGRRSAAGRKGARGATGEGPRAARRRPERRRCGRRAGEDDVTGRPTARRRRGLRRSDPDGRLRGADPDRAAGGGRAGVRANRALVAAGQRVLPRQNEKQVNEDLGDDLRCVVEVHYVTQVDDLLEPAGCPEPPVARRRATPGTGRPSGPVHGACVGWRAQSRRKGAPASSRVAVKRGHAGRPGSGWRRQIGGAAVSLRGGSSG